MRRLTVSKSPLPYRNDPDGMCSWGHPGKHLLSGHDSWMRQQTAEAATEAVREHVRYENELNSWSSVRASSARSLAKHEEALARTHQLLERIPIRLARSQDALERSHTHLADMRRRLNALAAKGGFPLPWQRTHPE
jgi:septal ring factor EnvC (AmiA/AmiB activator)